MDIIKEQEFLVTMDVLRHMIDSIQVHGGKNDRICGFELVYKVLTTLPITIQEKICNEDDSILYYFIKRTFTNKSDISSIVYSHYSYTMSKECIRNENLIHMKLINEVIPKHILTMNKRSANSLIQELVDNRRWMSSLFSNFIKLDKVLEYDTTNHFKKLIMKINLENK